MKKFLAIFLAAIFVMSFAASAFAIHAEIPSETQAIVAKGTTQITLGGELRTRGWYTKNLTSTRNPAEAGSAAWYDQRVRLSVDANVSPNVQGFIQLESGDSLTSDVTNWGNFNQHLPGFNILQAWILYKGTGLLGVPAGIKIGHMPLALGEKQFFDHTRFGDDAIVMYTDPTKELHVGFVTVKFMGDGNGHKAIPLAGIPANALAGSQWKNTDDLDGYVGVLTYKWDPKNTVGINYTYLNLSAADFNQQNLELHANGNISGLGYRASADFQFGGWGPADFKGMAFLVGLNYMFDPVNVRGTFGYGSGPKAGSTNIDTYVPYLSEVQNYTLIYEYLMNTTAGARATGLANTTYAQLGVDWKAMKDLSISGDVYWLNATKNITGGSRDAGWEVDGKLVYNVAKNLVYQIDAGYYVAGDFYGAAKKDVTVLRHMITLNF